MAQVSSAVQLVYIDNKKRNMNITNIVLLKAYERAMLELVNYKLDGTLEQRAASYGAASALHRVTKELKITGDASFTLNIAARELGLPENN
jgi:hypothetical protein